MLDFCCRASTVHTIPKTYKEALGSPEAESWIKAMNEEYDSLNENNTFTLKKLPDGKRAINGRWVYAVKHDNSDKEIFKARYVAKGFTQIHGSDYFDTYSPTAKMTSLRILMQFAAENELIVHQLDVKTAYLHAPIDCEIYMFQPEGYEQSNDLVCKLNKSLYGLKQSGRNWNTLLHTFFVNNSFIQSSGDACVYFTISLSIIILIWVDDIIVAAKTLGLIIKIKDILKSKFKMKDLGNITNFLGIQFNQLQGNIEMSQCQYVESILLKFGMSNCNPRYTPCELNPSSVVHSDSFDKSTRRFREIVGSLIYLMTCTRPDLSWTVTKLSQHLAEPTAADWVMVKHVLRYLKGTSDYKLCFTKTNGNLNLLGYTDSDWASSVDDRRSTSGYCFFLNNNGPPVSWKSKKQQTVALSSCEAEYMAIAAATQEATYLCTILKDFQISHEPVIVYTDSQSALGLVKNPINHTRSKHIDIRYHFVREKAADGIIDFRYVSSDQNVADIMTKALSKHKYNHFKCLLFGK